MDDERPRPSSPVLKDALMSQVSKIVAVLLIATVTAGFCAAHRHSSFAQLHQRLSGCHGHSGTPAQAPSHDCCLTAHDVAVLQMSDISRPHIHRKEADLPLEPLSATTSPAATDPSPICSAAPPGITPFRI